MLTFVIQKISQKNERKNIQKNKMKFITQKKFFFSYFINYSGLLA